MAAAAEDGTGLEPLSPSAFLELPPPTPCGDGDFGREDDPALPDDLVLPYISRMLMEEDIGDKFFYQYPDHPALLQAQQPFADILFGSGPGAAMDFSLDATTTTTSSSTGSSFSLSPSSSSGAPAFANATWPYDPLELTQRLTAGDANVNASTLPAGHDDVVQTQQLQSAVEEDGQRSVTTNTTMLAADDDASILFSNNNNRVDMDMLNQAFLKGMEEASKFLPATTLLTDTSMEGAKKKKMKAVEDLESETGRKSKLMVPEPEETGDEVDKIVTDGYALCLNQMESLSIAMANKKKKKKNNARTTKKGGRNEEAVDLQTLLLHCAQAVSKGDHLCATQLLVQIKQHSSSTGDANQRLAHCFAEGLQARLAGTGSELYRSAMAKRTPAVEFLKAYVLYLAVSCFHMTAYGFSNMTIMKAIVGNGKKRLHIVDYGMLYGGQWPYLLYCLGKLEGGPPEVRMTCIDVPQPGFRPIAQIQETGHRLTDFARRCGVSFSFHGIAAKWETVCADDHDIGDDEVLIVNNISSFGNLMDESVDVDSPSPRDMVLRNIHKMRPHVFIQTVVNGLHNTPFFVTRFREAFFYYSAFFDMLDAMAPRDNEQRLVVERDLIGRCAMNVIACEGLDRVERPETYRQWQVRNRQAGLRQLPLCSDTIKVCSQNVRKRYHKDFVIDVDHHWLLQGWKGRILYAMSTWAADDTTASEW